jgi:hypothetical protein
VGFNRHSWEAMGLGQGLGVSEICDISLSSRRSTRHEEVYTTTMVTKGSIDVGV